MREREIFFLTVAVLFSSVFSCYCNAQDNAAVSAKEAFIQSADEKKILRIGLIDCIAYTLKNNSTVSIKRIEPLLKEKDVDIEKAGFEPSFSADYKFHENNAPATSTAYPDVFRTKDTDFNAGISGTLVTGTKYDIGVTSERYKSNLVSQNPNPYYSVEPKITVTQPLFKGRGIQVNEADIVIARNNLSQSRESLREVVMDTLTQTEKAYYNYFYYVRRYDISRLLLDWTRQLLDIVKKRYAKGLASSVDLIEVEAASAQREKELITAESMMKKAGDELKLITSLINDPELWNADIELIDEPRLRANKVELTESLKKAFESRPDYASKKTELKTKDIKIEVAKDSMLPQIDLVASFGLNGLGDTYSRAIENIDGEYDDWSVGLEFTVPWGGKDRATYDKRKLEKAQALIELKRLEHNIILEVRDKVREIDVQFRQVEASKLAFEKESDNYAAQEKRYRAGEVNTHDLLEYRFRTSQAELDYLKALIDYNIALIELDRAEGTMLNKKNITLEDT